MGLPSWVYAGTGESEWEDKGIFLRNRRTGETRPKGISGGLPGLGKVETPGFARSYLDTVKETYRGVPARIKEGLATIPEAAVSAVNLFVPSSPQGHLQADPSAIYGDRGFARDTRESVREGYTQAREKLSEAGRGLPPLMAAGAEATSDLAAFASDPTNLIGVGAGKKLATEGVEAAARVAGREVAEQAPKGITSLAARVLPGEDISARFSAFLRGRGIEDPDLYHDLSDAARKALDKEFLAADAGPQGASWGRFLRQQGLRPDDYATLPGLERARLEGDFRKLLPETRQKATGATISPEGEAIPAPALDEAVAGVSTPKDGRLGLGRRRVGEYEDLGADDGPAGLTIEWDRANPDRPKEYLIYRDKEGKILAEGAIAYPKGGEPVVLALDADRSSGLARGRAVLAIGKEIMDRGVTDLDIISPDTIRLLESSLKGSKAAPEAAEFARRVLAARKGKLVSDPEAGFIRLGPGGPPTPPDPVLGAFHAEVFGKQPTSTVGEKLSGLGDRLQKEMVEAYTPLLKVARRFGPRAEDEIEVAIQRTRSAAHTQMNPVLRFTEEYDPLADAGKGDWVKTGESLSAIDGKLNPTEKVEFESILAAGSQVEFADRKLAAQAIGAADQASRTAQRNMLRLLGQEQRRELRGLSFEAKALRAEELAATSRGQRTLGRMEVLDRVGGEARRAGVNLPGGRMAAEEARHWSAGLEAEGAAAAAADTEGALRRGIGDLSRDEIRRYRERLAVARPPDIPDMRLDIDPVRTAQAREVMRHAEDSGLLKKYDELLGQASIDRSGPGTGYRGWADRAWLRPAVGAGFITEADRAAILGKNQMYSLFQQIDTLARTKGIDMAAGEVPTTPAFLKNAPPSVIHGVRKNPLETRMAGLQEGRQIAPVLEASAIQAARFQRLVDKQLVKNKLADIVERAPDLAPEIVRTTDPMAPGSFVAFKSGEKTYLQAPPDLLENLDRLTAKQSAFVLELAQQATGALRVAATTYTPGFPFGNVARDVQRGWITSQHGMLPGEPIYTMGKEIVHRLFNKFEPSAMWREFDEGVASYATFVKADSEGVNRAMQEVASASTGSPSARRIVDLVNPVSYLRELGQFKEASTRVTEKALAAKGGRSWFRGQANPAHVDEVTGAVRPRTRTESDLDAAKVSLNFMSGGSATREANRYYAFMNAMALDGADFFRQVSGSRKFTVIAKATAGITLPALYEVWHYRNDPEFRNLPFWDRSMFWHLGKIGNDIPPDSKVLADGRIRTPKGEILPPRTFWDGTWRRIPRPPGLFSLVFGILPSLAFEKALDSNPKAGEEAVAGLVEQTPMQYFLDYDEPTGDMNANLFPLVPDAIRPPLEAGTNLKGFPFGQAIDPRGTEEADPALRWNEQTPLWARAASERSAPGPYHGAVSPNRVQRVVEGYTAGAGKAVGGLVDRAMQGGTDANGDPYADSQEMLSPRDVPFLRSFMGSPAQGPGSSPVKEFWARYDSARQSSDVLKGWEDAGRADMAQKAKDAHPELVYKADLEEVAKRLRELAKERKEVLASPFHVLGTEQKRAYMELIDQGMTQAAAQLLLYIQQQEQARLQGGG